MGCRKCGAPTSRRLCRHCELADRYETPRSEKSYGAAEDEGGDEA